MVNSVIYHFNVPNSFKTAIVAELKNPHKAKRSFISVKKAVNSNMFRRRSVHVKKRRKHLQEKRWQMGR